MKTEEISCGAARRLMQQKNPPGLIFIAQMEMGELEPQEMGPTYHRGVDSEGRDTIFVWYFFPRYSHDLHTVVDSRRRQRENSIREILGVAHT